MPLKTTLLVMTFNQAAFVEASLESAFAQDDDSIDLVISDDHSSDETPTLIRQFLTNRETSRPVRFLERVTNSGGPSAHLNALASVPMAELVVLQAGDDVAMPQRVRRLREVFETDNSIMALYHGARLTTESGRDLGSFAVPHPAAGQDHQLWFASANHYALGACLAIRRSLLELFPPLGTKAHEDVLLPFRAALAGQILYLPEELLIYRRHAGSISDEEHRIGSVRDYFQLLEQNKRKAEEIARAKLDDIAWALNKGWIDRSRAGELSDETRRSVESHDISIALASPSIFRRLKALWKLRREQPNFRHWAIAVFRVLSPSLYLRRRRTMRRRQGLEP